MVRLAAHNCAKRTRLHTHHAPPAAAHIQKRRFAPVDETDRAAPAGVPGRTVITDPAGAFVNFELDVAARGAVGHETPFVDSFSSFDASSGGPDAKLTLRDTCDTVGTHTNRSKNAVKTKRKRGSQDALRYTLMTLLLVLGSAAPVAIAFFLVASTNDENPLDKIPDYETLPSETLVVPFNRGEPIYTEFEYWDKVRLVIEGTGQTTGTAYRDAFYLFTDASGQPLETPQTATFELEIDGERAITALGLTGDPPPYDPKHLYAVIYDAGPRARRIAFHLSDENVGDNTGELMITVVQLK
jgi:hypothetical protein